MFVLCVCVCVRATEPNNDSPLNGYAAQLWDNQAEYKAVLLKKYAEAKGDAATK